MIGPRDLVAGLTGRWTFRPRDRAPRHDLLLLLFLGALIFSSGLGLRDPWPADEPRFALIAREMVETGEWLFPRRAAELYADKPPLYLWSVAAVYAASHSIRVANLLPSLLAGLVTLCLVYDLGRRMWHRRAGLGAALALLLIAQFPLQAKTGQIDAMATMWTTLGLYGLCRHLLSSRRDANRPSWRWWNIAFFAMGLGVITKGVGFLPLLALIPWGVARLRGWPGVRHLRGGWRWWLGPLLFLAAISTWLAPMLFRVAASGDSQLLAYRNEILWSQTAERYTSIQGHQRPFLYYPTVAMPLLWMPLTLFLPWLVPAWWRRLRRRDPRYLVLLGWIALVAIFFSFSSGKRGVYILPAAPAFALAIGPLAAGLERQAGVRRVAFGLLVLLTAVFLVAAGGGLLGTEWAAALEAKEGLSPWAFLAALGLAGLAAAAWLRPRNGVAALAGFLFCVWLLYGWWGYPLVNPVRSSQPFMARVASHIGPSAELAMVGWKEQLILHADRPVNHWGFVPDHLFTSQVSQRQTQPAAAWLDGGPESRWLLTSERWLTPCFSRQHAAALGVRHRRRWFLVDRSALTGACGPGTEGWPVEEVPSYRTDWAAP